MSSHSRTTEAVKKALRENFERAEAFFELPQEIRSFRPDNETWSIDQILEHLTLTNHYLLIIIRRGTDAALKKAQDEPLPLEEESDLDILEAIGIRRSFEWRAPVHMNPTGEKGTGEIRQIMREQCEESLALLDKMSRGEGALNRIGLSVNNLGKLDMYQWLYFLAGHLHRHLAQLEEVRDSFIRRG